MNPTLYRVETEELGGLALMARPRGGEWLEDELRSLRDEGLDIIVSALTGPELQEFELTDEARIAMAVGLEFVSIPIPDMGTPPDFGSAVGRLEMLAEAIGGRRNVAVHCRMSIGRSSLIAAGVLVIRGSDPDDAFRRIAAARGVRVPETDSQRRWVEDLAEWLPTRAR
jgi:protein-tyrosine phosphatase